MANHKSALKRARQNIERRTRNRANKTRIKNVIKEVRQLAAENPGQAAEKLNVAKSVIAKAAKKGSIHKNTASRKISRLTKFVNSVSA